MLIFYLLSGAAVLVGAPFVGVLFIVNGLKQKRRWLVWLGVVTLLLWLAPLVLLYFASRVY